MQIFSGTNGYINYGLWCISRLRTVWNATSSHWVRRACQYLKIAGSSTVAETRVWYRKRRGNDADRATDKTKFSIETPESGLDYSFFLNSIQGENIPHVQNLPLTSKLKFRFGLACLGLSRPIRNFCFEVNRRFWTSGIVTLFKTLLHSMMQANFPIEFKVILLVSHHGM